MSHGAALRLDAPATVAALPWQALVDELITVCREQAAGLIHCPTRLVVPLADAGTLLVMPVVSPGLSLTKLVTVHAGNAAQGLPTIQGEVIVMDTQTGQRLMQLDGPALTARRTAAVSVLALQALGLPAQAKLLLVGTGAQALAHAQGLQALMPNVQLWVQGRSAAQTAAFVQALHEQQIPAQDLTLVPPGLRFDGAITTTTSRTPVLDEARLLEGACVVAVGAYRHDMAELPPTLVRRAQLWVDDFDGARAEAGDYLQADVDWAQVRSLQDLVLPAAPVLIPDGGQVLRVFKSVGCARWDLAAARVAARSLSA